MKSINLIIAYCFGLFSFFGTAQTNKNTTAVYLEKAQDYSKPIDSLLRYHNFIIKNAKNETEKGLSYHYLGNAYLISGKLELAQKMFETENKVFSNSKNQSDEIKNHLAASFASLGIVASQQSNYAKALDFHFKAKSIFEETKNIEKQTAIENNIAIEYQSLNKFDKANVHFLKASKLNTKNYISNTLLFTNMGKNYLKKNDFQNAYVYLNLAKKQQTATENLYTIAELDNAFAAYYLKTKQINLALPYLQKAAATCEKIDYTFGLSETYFLFGLYYEQSNEIQPAIEYFNKAQQLANELSILELQLDTNLHLATIYNNLQQFEKANSFSQKALEFQEKSLQQSNEKAIAFVEMQAELDKKSAHLELVHQKHKQNTILFIALGVLALLIIGFAYYYSQQKWIKKNLQLQKQIAEWHHKALHLQMNPHFIFNCLGSISSFILQEENELALDYLTRFSKLMRLTLENSKDSEIQLYKEIELLQQYCELEKLRYENKFDYQIHQSKSIHDELKIPPMLLQPLIENAIMHGIVPKESKGKIDIYFDYLPEKKSLSCTIKDNGIGYFESIKIKKKSVLQHHSMALEVLKNRVEAIG